MSDNNFQFGDSAQNQLNNNANLSSEATAAWMPLSIIKKKITPEAQLPSGYSDYVAHDWQVHKQNGGIDSLQEDGGLAVPVRTDNLGTDRFGNSVIGLSYKNSDAQEVRLVMHFANGEFLGMEDRFVPNPQGGPPLAKFTDVLAGSPNEAPITLDMKQLASPNNAEYQFLQSKLTDLNRMLGPVQPQASTSNLEQMLNQVEQGPYQTSRPMDIPTTSPQMPQYQGNYNPLPVQRQRYSYQGNYQKYPTNDQLINQSRGAGIMNSIINGLAPRFRNTHDGSMYQHIPVSNGVERPRPSVYQGQYQHLPANDGTKDVSAILEAKRQRLIQQGRLPSQQQTYESGQQSNTQTNVYGQLEKRY